MGKNLGGALHTLVGHTLAEDDVVVDVLLVLADVLLGVLVDLDPLLDLAVHPGGERLLGHGEGAGRALRLLESSVVVVGGLENLGTGGIRVAAVVDQGDLRTGVERVAPREHATMTVNVQVDVTIADLEAVEDLTGVDVGHLGAGVGVRLLTLAPDHRRRPLVGVVLRVIA